MKKILLLSIVALFMTGSAFAGCNDEGGTEIKVDNDTFCVSKVSSLNWWSAQLWCQSHKMTLATIKELCPEWNGAGGSSCGRRLVSESDYNLWSATADGGSNAYYLSGSAVYGFGRGGNKTFHAACIAK